MSIWHYSRYFKWFAKMRPDIIAHTVDRLKERERRQWGWWGIFAIDADNRYWHFSLIHFKGKSIFYPVHMPSGHNVFMMPTYSAQISKRTDSVRDIVMELAVLGHKPSRAIMRRKWKKIENEIKKRNVVIFPEIKDNVWRICHHLCSDKAVVIEDYTGFSVGYKTYWCYLGAGEKDVTRLSAFNALCRVCGAQEALNAVARNDEEKRMLLTHMLVSERG